MNRKIKISFLILLQVIWLLVGMGADAHPAIEVKYSQIADFFNFMDNLSQWGASTSDEYYIFWEKNYLEPNDIKILKKYATIRKKHFKDIQNVIFPTNQTEDPIADVFYHAKNIQDALKGLEKILTTDELQIIKETVEHFKKRIDLIISSDNKQAKMAVYFDGFLKEKNVSEYIDAICNFYSVKYRDIKTTIFTVWWPTNKKYEAICIGKTILIYGSFLQEMPKDISFIKAELSSILLHELTHSISKARPESQKKLLSSTAQRYATELNITRDKYIFLVEEPLAVILGQMIFLERTFPQYYKYMDNWYSNAWIKSMARLAKPLVFEYLSHHRPMDKVFVENYMKLISELIQANEFIKKNA